MLKKIFITISIVLLSTLVIAREKFDYFNVKPNMAISYGDKVEAALQQILNDRENREWENEESLESSIQKKTDQLNDFIEDYYQIISDIKGKERSHMPGLGTSKYLHAGLIALLKLEQLVRAYKFKNALLRSQQKEQARQELIDELQKSQILFKGMLGGSRARTGYGIRVFDLKDYGYLTKDDWENIDALYDKKAYGLNVFKILNVPFDISDDDLDAAAKEAAEYLNLNDYMKKVLEKKPDEELAKLLDKKTGRIYLETALNRLPAAQRDKSKNSYLKALKASADFLRFY